MRPCDIVVLIIVLKIAFYQTEPIDAPQHLSSICYQLHQIKRIRTWATLDETNMYPFPTHNICMYVLVCAISLPKKLKQTRYYKKQVDLMKVLAP